jgi:hypothetical protein
MGRKKDGEEERWGGREMGRKRDGKDERWGKRDWEMERERNGGERRRRNNE